MGAALPPAAERLGPPGIRGLPLIVALGVLVTLIGVILLVGSGAGLRFGLWDVAVAAGMMWTGAWICFGGALLSLLAAAMTRPGTPYRGFPLAVAAALIGLAGFGALVYWHYAHRPSQPSSVSGPTARAPERRPAPSRLREAES